MRIALCLSGYFNSIKDSTSFGDDGYLYIKKHILDEVDNGHQVDVFFHNWEPNLYDKIVNLYKPKKYIIEPQIDFEKVADQHKVSRIHLDKHNKLGTWSINSSTGTGYVGPERLLSQFYSVQKSFELKRQYEEDNNFKYDLLRLYNMVKEKNIIETEECGDRTIVSVTKPTSYTIDQIDQQYSDIYFLKLYFKIRFWEDESTGSESDRNELEKDCIEIYRSQGILRALYIFERIVNKPFDYRGSLSYISKEIDAKREAAFQAG